MNPGPDTDAMKCLVACSRCARQYDARALAAGSRFHCECGVIVEVPRFRPHDAAVVRCSSCGAPRAAQAACCEHCRADFTVRETDLSTICPGCMARLGSRARFCHQCATPILSAESAGEPTDKRCPGCGPRIRLNGRSLGQPSVPVLECVRCAGLWLGRRELGLLVERARERQTPEAIADGSRRAEEVGSSTAPQAYRRCPECRKHMNRRLFGRLSGIIIDTCREHGSWLDAHELEAILSWVRSGGEAAAARRSEQDDRHRERMDRVPLLADARLGKGEPEPLNWSGEFGFVWDALVAVLNRLSRTG